VSDPQRGGRLLRANLSVGLGTLISRITGLLRVGVLGWALGQDFRTDAYNSANNAPNAVYELLVGGVLSATLVPVFTEHLEKDDDEATSAVVSVAAIAITVLTAIAVMAAPLIFRLFSLNPADDVDPERFRALGSDFAYLLLPQIFFYGLMALASALVNARRHFFAPAWAPILNNIVVIVVLVMMKSRRDDIGVHFSATLLLGLGTTTGIALMTIVTLPALRRAGVRLRFRPNWRHPAVRKVIRLSGWTFGYVAANQVALVAVQNLARPGSGRVSAYVMAFTFFQLPHALLAVSITTTFVPELARSVQRHDRLQFVERMTLGLRSIAVLTIPASIGFLVLSRPLVAAALQRGNFDAADVVTTSRALAGFAVGLFGFSAYLFILRGFYAHQDTRTPFVVNVVENAINVVLAIVLVHFYDVLGLGLAFGLAYLLAAALALNVLHYKIGGLDLRALLISLGRMLLAAVVMGEIVWLATRPIGSDHGAAAIARVVTGAVVGVATYVGVLVVLGAPELSSVMARVRRAFKS
jgi:putative peptidoglycan lipid II flippase